MLNKKSILIVAAHPDDEVLGCGGSIAKWSNLGCEIHVLIMAEGVTSRDIKRNRDLRKEELIQLGKSAKKAGQILGVSTVENLDYPDNRMDSVDLLDVVKSIEEQIERRKPEVVVTHHSNDLNIDHQVIHQAVMTSCRPYPNNSIKRIISFEVPSATDWQSPIIGHSFVPNIFVNIQETLELKIRALEVYESEMREWPHARSINAVKHLAGWRGASVGCKAAEAFMLIREVN